MPLKRGYKLQFLFIPGESVNCVHDQHRNNQINTQQLQAENAPKNA